MTMETKIDPETAWQAFERRDRNYDGRFVGAVRTTGIYCKPSCPARHAKREHMDFYPDPKAARSAGFRACLRCKPDEVGRERTAMARAVHYIEHADGLVTLERVAEVAGYAPHHFHRLFKRATGVTPAAYQRALRSGRATEALSKEARVTDAIYEAGYSAPSRFYAETGSRLGMTPSAWKRGGAGVTIRWVIAGTSLGPLLIAATDRGLCRVSFDEGEAALKNRFPAATIEKGGAALMTLAKRIVAEVENPGHLEDLPLDVKGTAFQEAVWQALRSTPAGETRSYSELAAIAGNPKAVRAAGTACGANHLAVVIPCHRAQRSDGTMGGYAYGVDRKIALRKREGVD